MTTPTRLHRTRPPRPITLVHFGPGAFFRAFTAMFTRGEGLCAISLKSRKAYQQLAPQGGAYTAIERGADGERYRVIESISEVLHAPDDPQAVLARLCDPALRIVSLTITEKGYCFQGTTRSLDLEHPDIAHDLVHWQHPRSAIGFLYAALAQRRAHQLSPFTVLSCDNLASNGETLRQLVLAFAQHIDPGVAAWIRTTVPFPCSMVDRITPQTTDTDIESLAAHCGYHDPACVVHEPFWQWVIEDRYIGTQPLWPGVQYVDAVAPYESMKLRCLNGSHSALAYLGYLAGYQNIAQTIRAPAYAQYCQQLWSEIIPTLSPPSRSPGHSSNSSPEHTLDNPLEYCKALLTRFRNPSIEHRTWQIAMDGSQKLPQRILAPLQEHLAGQDRAPAALCLAVAAWLRYVGGYDDAGMSIDVRDPLAARLREISDAHTEHDARVAALLAVDAVFAPALATNSTFLQAVQQAYRGLALYGAKAMVASMAATPESPAS